MATKKNKKRKQTKPKKVVSTRFGLRYIKNFITLAQAAS
jgi:hypothetical protein